MIVGELIKKLQEFKENATITICNGYDEFNFTMTECLSEEGYTKKDCSIVNLYIHKPIEKKIIDLREYCTDCNNQILGEV